MGYVHHGMLPEPAQKAVDQLKPGEVSEPVALLEGIGVFKLQGRKSPGAQSAGPVRERCKDLYLRDKVKTSGTRCSPSCARTHRSSSTSRASFRWPRPAKRRRRVERPPPGSRW